MTATENMFDLEAFVARARRIGTDEQKVEVKTAAGGLPKDVVETLSAFANGSGGTLICGLSEEDGFIPAMGFDAKRIADALEQTCNDKMEPPIRAEITTDEFEGASLVVTSIPELAPHLKPCYVKARTPYDGSFIRSSDGDKKLSRYEVDRIMEERRQPRYDVEAVEGATIADLDQDLIQGLLKRERANSPYVFGKLSDEDALVSMGVLTCREKKALCPTLAGIMALGVHPQQFFPRLNVSFAVIPGTSKSDLSPVGDRFLDSRTIIGSIPVMIAETLASVRRNMRVTSRIEGAFRIDTSDYPEVAVREALANALMHRDYSPEGQGTQVQVNMYDDRLEISNPGGLYGAVTVDRLGEFDVSASRNQTLARILESTPYPVSYAENGYVVENKGTGYFQIKRSLEEASMEPPQPLDLISMFYLTMWKRKSSVLASASIALWNLKGTDVRIVDYLESHDEPARSADIAEALGIAKSTVTRRLARLIETGLVERIGGVGGPGIRYRKR